MATTIKEKGSSSAGEGTEKKMKKAISPNPQPPKKAPTKSSATQHTQSSSTDQKPEKPLPNYLKPTISSSHDFSSTRTSRRTTADPKPHTTNRRHSVERLPLPAHTHKAPSTKPAPQRSFSSLSSSKPAKTGAGPSMMRRSLSAKGATSSKAVTKTDSKNVAPPESSAELETQKNNGKDLVEIPSDSDVLKTLSQEEPLVESAVVMEEEEEAHDEAVVKKAEEGEQRQQEEKAQEQDQAPYENVESPVVVEEKKTIDKKDEEEEMELEDHVDEEKGTEEIKEKDAAVELEQESGEGNKEVQKENKKGGPSKQTQSGKEAQAYNDVIEETASKLMEDNSANKVRALAGAFETVISLQDTK